MQTRPWESTWSLVITQGMDINTNSGSGKTMDPDMALGINWAERTPWPWMALQATQSSIVLTAHCLQALTLSQVVAQTTGFLTAFSGNMGHGINTTLTESGLWTQSCLSVAVGLGHYTASGDNVYYTHRLVLHRLTIFSSTSLYSAWTTLLIFLSYFFITYLLICSAPIMGLRMPYTIHRHQPLLYTIF